MTLVCTSDAGGDLPAQLPRHILQAIPATTVYLHAIYLHAMQSVVDWFAYGMWADGRLRRSFSVSSDEAVRQDLGARLPFEIPLAGFRGS